MNAPDIVKTISHQLQDSESSTQITLRLTRAQLLRLNAAAKRQGIPRASYIKRAIALQMEADQQ